jgi:prevent-host-death family protein
MQRTVHVSMTEAKQRFGEFVKRAVYGGERVIVEFRGKPQAMIVACETDKHLPTAAEQLSQLDRMIALSKQIEARTGVQPDSAEELRKLREERDEQLSGLR